LPVQSAVGILLALVDLCADRMNGRDQDFAARGNRFRDLSDGRHRKHQAQGEKISDDNRRTPDEGSNGTRDASEEFRSRLLSQHKRISAVAIDVDSPVASPPDRIDLHCALHSVSAAWMRLMGIKDFEPRLICP
jgi:hypothetical protein